jgi:hypothetical protein
MAADMNHHRDHGPDNDFSSSDPAGRDRASYSAHPIDSIEPVDLAPNAYRAISLDFLKLMFCVDEYLTAAPDARLAVITVAVVLGWPSARGLTVPEIAEQLGISTSTITRACARFHEMAGLGVSVAGGVRFVRPGAGSSNGDKPAAVQSVGQAAMRSKSVHLRKAGD